MKDHELKVRRYLLDKIIPERANNLVSGPSGIGKTRIVFQILEDWMLRGEVFGHKAEVVDPAYFCYDRTRESILETIKLMDIKIRFPVYSMVDLNHFELPAKEAVYGHNLIILDSVEILMQDINNFSNSAHLWTRMIRFCKDNNLSIISILGAPKIRIGEGYSNPRERTLGSSATSRFSETVIIMSSHSEDPDDTRSDLWICPRNYTRIHITLGWDNTGRLEQIDLTSQDVRQLYSILPKEFSWEQALEIGLSERADIHPNTVRNHLNTMIGNGLIIRVSLGRYKKVKMS